MLTHVLQGFGEQESADKPAPSSEQTQVSAEESAAK